MLVAGDGVLQRATVLRAKPGQDLRRKKDWQTAGLLSRSKGIFLESFGPPTPCPCARF